MAIQTINLGTYANDGTGDDLRTAFTKVNNNFAELTSTINVNTAANLGTGAGVFYQKNINVLEFKSLTSVDNSVVITSSPTSVDLKAQGRLEDDPLPTVVAPVWEGTILTNPFNLNQNVIINGNVETTVWNLDLRQINSLLELLIVSNQFNIDLGTIPNPTLGTTLLDMNGLLYDGFDGTPQVPNIDFGTFE